MKPSRDYNRNVIVRSNLFVEEAVHVVGGARVQGVLLLLEARSVGQHVVALRLLPQVVELHQFAHRPRPHLQTSAN